VKKISKSAVIEVRNVSFSYGGQPVLENVSLEIESGDFVGMVGPNGAGKTTLARIILGLMEPDEGDVRLFGLPNDNPQAKRRVGYVPQNATNFDQNFPATVYEVVEMGRVQRAKMLHGFTDSDRKITEDALEKTGMVELRNARIGRLSGGQQQRAFIARALAAEPDLLILDEPAVGVDSQMQEKFYSILTRLNKGGITIILISHDVGVVSRHANKLACVNRTVVLHDLEKEHDASDHLCSYKSLIDIEPCRHGKGQKC
jgi:zinc transport system ATP-binding protein